MSTPRTPASWSDTFMSIAAAAAGRSKDPNTQVGAVIVSPDNRVLSLGYNGAPNGFPDDLLPWRRDGDTAADTKYPYVIHAERNAVLNFRGSLRELSGATVYITHFPCVECTKELIQVGVQEIVYQSGVTHGDELSAVTERLIEVCGITVRQAAN